MDTKKNFAEYVEMISQIVEGLDITTRVAEIEDRAYTTIPDFIAPDEIERIRHAFDTEVPITEMRAIGTETGKTLRAHNLLARLSPC